MGGGGKGGGQRGRGGEGGPQGRAPQAPVGGAAAKPAAGGLPCGPQPGTLQKAGGFVPLGRDWHFSVAGGIKLERERGRAVW